MATKAVGPPSHQQHLAMTVRRSFAFTFLLWSLVTFIPSTRSLAESATTPSVTIEQIAAEIEKHIAAHSAAGDGYFKILHKKRELNLQLVRVHLEYLSHLGDGVSFACVDLVDTEGPVYDVDFFLEGPPGAMTVTETSVHKINGRPLYAWQPTRDGSWRKVSAGRATPRLLGVLHGSDEFTFTYRAQLPKLEDDARLWLPIATSDAFQQVEIRSMTIPGQWKELEEPKYGNKILFIEATPADSGAIIEIEYQVTRLEKPAYPSREPPTENDLAADILVPANDTFRSIAREVTEGKTNDIARARALYDHVSEELRYAKYGIGWGRGDAVYACDARSGNCTDFHAYFIALARAIGIPARFAIGASLPSERNDGGTDGYHCWAEFYANDKWIPVDISEANKHTTLASYYFGHHPANRFELSRGRDLVVDPQPASGPINFLAFPVMEIAGEPVSLRPEFQFRRTGRPTLTKKIGLRRYTTPGR